MKRMSIAAVVIVVLAALIGSSPFLVAFSGTGGSDFEKVGWVFLFFTIPLGLLMSFVAFGLSIAVSIIGISRARNGSGPRLLIAIGALVLMVVPTLCILVVLWVGSSGPTPNEPILLAVFGVVGSAGFVLGVITGFIAPARKPKVEAVAS